MATCKDCIHNEACKAVLDAAGFFSDDIEEILNEIKCPNFADKSRFVELPCAVNSRVSVIRSATSDNRNLYITDEMIDHYRVFGDRIMMCFYSHRLAIPDYQWDNVFSGKNAHEEAEAALAERSKT